MFDGEQKLVVCNMPYLDIYGLCSVLVRPGITFRRDSCSAKAIGGYAAAPEELVLDMAKQVQQNVKFTHLATTARRPHHPRNCLIRLIAWWRVGCAFTQGKTLLSVIVRISLIAHIAHHDALTGLPNRIEMEQEAHCMPENL